MKTETQIFNKTLVRGRVGKIDSERMTDKNELTWVLKMTENLQGHFFKIKYDFLRQTLANTHFYKRHTLTHTHTHTHSLTHYYRTHTLTHTHTHYYRTHTLTHTHTRALSLLQDKLVPHSHTS